MAWGGDQRRGSVTAVIGMVAVVAATSLVLLVAVWAASTGPGDPLPGEGLNPDRVSTSDPPTTTAPPAEEAGEEGEPSEGSDVLNRIVAIVLAAIVVLMVGCVVWLLVSVRPRLPRLRRRARRPAAAPDAEPDVVAAVATALAEDADEQARLLGEGSPRNGIVACWHRFEVTAEQVGVAREEWETSAEFTMRLLDLVAADEHAVSRLGVLYREARFSDHEVTEADRDEARGALGRVHGSLTAGARSGSGRPQ